jgi:predicted oxidoreductase
MAGYWTAYKELKKSTNVKQFSVTNFVYNKHWRSILGSKILKKIGSRQLLLLETDFQMPTIHQSQYLLQSYPGINAIPRGRMAANQRSDGSQSEVGG